jgi:hypothetical protein
VRQNASENGQISPSARPAILMSAARDLFLEVPPLRVAAGDDAYDKLSRAAELWRQEGQHFSAGVAMFDASDAAWGQPDRMLEALRLGMADLEFVISEQAPTSPASLAALYKLRQSTDRTSWFSDADRATVSARVRELSSELGQRLFKHFKNSENADGYLVRGIVIVTDRDGIWDTRFPDYEVPSSIEQPGQELLLNIPSAFRLFVSTGEWQAAHEIVNLRKIAFTTSGLKGWQAVTLGHVNPGETVARFDEAADFFIQDAIPPTAEDMMRRGGHWSGINQQLWAKYFRARARLVESIRTPTKVKELLDRAADALADTESGWHSGEVSRFHVLIKVMAKLLSDPLSFDAEEARREYALEIRMSGEVEQDRLALTFITEAASGFRGFATDPGSEITRNRLELALGALERIPTIGPEVTNAVRPEIGKKALATILGPIRTWMHRSLGGITDEAQFRLILLRLLQNGLPIYAQVRHGPLEYGKDIVALLEIDGEIVLRQYQVKCGDIDRKKWRESKDEMETMFQVPLTSFQLPIVPQRIEGILITNGHANPYIEPVIDGWLQEQRETHKRLVEFMHLDALVDWITKGRLVNELRAALREHGIDTGEA